MIGMLEKDLKQAHEDAQYFHAQESMRHQVLNHKTEECNQLREANAKLAEEKQ